MSSVTVRKTYNLPPDLLKQAKRILKARTETEAVVISLQEVARTDSVERAIRRASGRLPNFKPLR